MHVRVYCCTHFSFYENYLGNMSCRKHNISIAGIAVLLSTYVREVRGSNLGKVRIAALTKGIYDLF